MTNKLFFSTARFDVGVDLGRQDYRSALARSFAIWLEAHLAANGGKVESIDLKPKAGAFIKLQHDGQTFDLACQPGEQDAAGAASRVAGRAAQKRLRNWMLALDKPRTGMLFLPGRKIDLRNEAVFLLLRGLLERQVDFINVHEQP